MAGMSHRIRERTDALEAAGTQLLLLERDLQLVLLHLCLWLSLVPL
ncbi:hypothetical protein AAHE18_18G090500 [Arachis hypogaea]